jgi:hypothetical protein
VQNSTRLGDCTEQDQTGNRTMGKQRTTRLREQEGTEQDQTCGTGQNRNRTEQDPIGGTEEGRTGPDWVTAQIRTRLGNRTYENRTRLVEQDRTEPDRRNRRAEQDQTCGTGEGVTDQKGAGFLENQTLGTAGNLSKEKFYNEYTQSESIFTVYLTLFISFSVNVASEPYRVTTVLNSLSENMAEQKRLLIYFII